MAVNENAEEQEAPAQGNSSPTDGWNPDLNQDEAIRAQEKKIEKDISDRLPLVSGLVGLEVLSDEYVDDKVYHSKIKDLKMNYDALRRTRPDGNCFYRAFAYAYFETILDDEIEHYRFKAIIEDRKNDLLSLGFAAFTLEDFYDQFVGVLDRISDKEIKSKEDLLKAFNDQGLSDYLVVFLRLITSGYLQKNAEFYSNFIEGHATVKDFCSQEVEPMYRESDHIHIIALTSATEVAVQINYLDRSSSGEKVNVHNFPEGSTPRIHLLYRPGHYDIIYRKNEPAI